MFALLLAATAADPLVTFRNWVVGCDNGRSCMAVGQYSEADSDLASIVVQRGADATDVPKIWFANQDKPALDLAADGKRLGVNLTTDADGWAVNVDPASVPAVVAALRSATSLVPVLEGGAKATPLSISGASAALRWIDVQQRRSGTVTALVATGTASAATVPPPPALPTVRQAVPSGNFAPRLSDEDIKKIQQQYAGCADEDDLQNKVSYGRVDARSTLALITAVCGSGAYNYFGIPLMIRDNGQRVLATFEGQTEGDTIMNMTWDDKTRVLSTSFKGRGLGDCGGSTDYVWDGKIFRPIEEAMMDECLGAIAWIPTFRARAVPAN